MNTIAVKAFPTPYQYRENYLVIDGRSLPEWFDHYKDDEMKHFGTLSGLCPAWSEALNFRYDIRFIWTLTDTDERVILPILVCEDDLDLDCIVLVADVYKEKDSVYWNRIGRVTHQNEAKDMDLHRYGILYHESYTDKDWETYGSNIALSELYSAEWHEWVTENSAEEWYRIRMNYTEPYYQKEGSIKWLADVHWQFSRQEYEKCLNVYREKVIVKYPDLAEFLIKDYY